MNSYLRFEQKLIGNIGHEDDDEVWIGKIKQLYSVALIMKMLENKNWVLRLEFYW